MAGDARRKGGAYSDNPNTVRTRLYNSSLGEKAKELKSKRFSEYRALRSACINTSRKAEYFQERTREGKLAILRRACTVTLQRRRSKCMPMMGYDIEEFITRYHDKSFLRGIGQRDDSPASEFAVHVTPSAEGMGADNTFVQASPGQMDDNVDGNIDDNINKNVAAFDTGYGVAGPAYGPDAMELAMKVQELQGEQIQYVIDHLRALTLAHAADRARMDFETQARLESLEAINQLVIDIGF
ncbi:hypothetical protein EsH8_VIII_000953 [Colletotrichum jinshuiense]